MGRDKMAGVVKLAKLTSGRAGFHTMAVRCASGSPPPWNYLWKPGPFPETEDERMACAKKYGLIYEDYKPYPKGSDVMAGDYPDLPLVPEGRKDPYYNWDYPEYRRDYGEPLHENFDMYRETKYTPELNPRDSRLTMFGCFLGMLGLFFGGVWLTTDNPWIPHMKHPVIAMQLPKEGVTHYTFEPAE